MSLNEIPSKADFKKRQPITIQKLKKPLEISKIALKLDSYIFLFFNIRHSKGTK